MAEQLLFLNFQKKFLHSRKNCDILIKLTANSTDGRLVKRLRRRPLTAETGVRFPYRLLLYRIEKAVQLRSEAVPLFLFKIYCRYSLTNDVLNPIIVCMQTNFGGADDAGQLYSKY